MEHPSATAVWVTSVCVLYSVDLNSAMVEAQANTSKDVELRHIDICWVSESVDVKNYFNGLTRLH